MTDNTNIAQTFGCKKHSLDNCILVKASVDESNFDYQQWDLIVEQMDIIVMPSDWSYFDRKVPTQVT